MPSFGSFNQPPPRWLPSEGDIGEDKLSWELTPGPWYGACLTHSLSFVAQ